MYVPVGFYLSKYSRQGISMRQGDLKLFRFLQIKWLDESGTLNPRYMKLQKIGFLLEKGPYFELSRFRQVKIYVVNHSVLNT